MATALAQQGILTCVVQYSLYPQAKAQDMVQELSSALSWTLDNIHAYGGNPNKVRACSFLFTVCKSCASYHYSCALFLLLACGDQGEGQGDIS